MSIHALHAPALVEFNKLTTWTTSLNLGLEPASIPTSTKPRYICSSIGEAVCVARRTLCLSCKAIQLSEQLVDCVVTFIIASLLSRPTGPAHGIQLINKDDAGGQLASLNKAAAAAVHAGGKVSSQQMLLSYASIKLVVLYGRGGKQPSCCTATT